MNERRSSLQAASKGLALDQANRRMNQFMFRFASIWFLTGFCYRQTGRKCSGSSGF